MCFDTDGYADIYETNAVKCRKPHKCLGCRRVIERGEMAQYTSCLFDGHWSNWYLCNGCQRITLAIVIEELESGCSWNEAWCPPEELSTYLRDRHEPVRPLGMPTLDDCRRYLDCYTMGRSWIRWADEFSVDSVS